MWNTKCPVFLLCFVIAGCDRGSRLYTDSVTDQFGNAVKTNIVSQASDMRPPRSTDKNIVTYTDKDKLIPPRAVPAQGGSSASSGAQSGGS